MKNDLMNEKEFWSIIEVGKDSQYVEFVLDEELKKLSLRNLVMFQAYMNTFRTRAHRLEIERAIYIINGYYSDDNSNFFRAGLIARGEKIFKNAIENPDSLADLDKMIEMTPYFAYIALVIYKEVTGEYSTGKEVLESEWPPEYHEAMEGMDFGFFEEINRHSIFTDKKNMKYLPKLMKKYGNRKRQLVPQHVSMLSDII